MKTKDEIEQLAFLRYPRLINDPYNPMEDDNTYERQIWIDAYTQCQEDMFDSLLANKLRSLYGDSDKKYAEKDIIDAVLFGMQKGLNVGKINETDNDWVNNYINSLNKQNND